MKSGLISLIFLLICALAFAQPGIHTGPMGIGFTDNRYLNATSDDIAQNIIYFNEGLHAGISPNLAIVSSDGDITGQIMKSSVGGQNIWLDAKGTGNLRVLESDGIFYVRPSNTTVSFFSSSTGLGMYSDKQVKIGQSGSNYGRLIYVSASDKMNINTIGTTGLRITSNTGAIDFDDDKLTTTGDISCDAISVDTTLMVGGSYVFPTGHPGVDGAVISYDTTTDALVWGTIAGGGGGGTPGGSDTQVQFNDASSFAGDAGLVYDKTANNLTADIVSTDSLQAKSSTLYIGTSGTPDIDIGSLGTTSIGDGTNVFTIAQDGDISFGGTAGIDDNINPKTDNTHTLGTGGLQWSLACINTISADTMSIDVVRLRPQSASPDVAAIPGSALYAHNAGGGEYQLRYYDGLVWRKVSLE